MLRMMMASNQLLSAYAVTTILTVIASIFIMRRLRAAKRPDHLDLTSSLTEHAIRLSKSLSSALPDSVIFPHDTATFKQSMRSYWAQQECEVIPSCVVRPRDVQQLCIAITVLKREYDEQRRQEGEETELEGKNAGGGLFAIRSGGHSPVANAASIRGGVMIDLSLFGEITPSEDRSSVVIGAGSKWMHVSQVLDEKGLVVVGGRNSDVGVGGLTLGGGISFFTPRFGLVASNILSYEVVLASGTVTTASASKNPDLWHALNGGSNNFGIVTRFTARAFPFTKVWGGFLYMTAGQTTKVLAAFHEFVNRADPSNLSTKYDSNAAGPLACFTYVQPLGIQAISVNLVYTKPSENEKKWPDCWDTSSFRSIRRLWSTCKVRTLTNATDEMNTLNPAGKRQIFGTTTIKNDPATLAAAHTAYHDAIASIRRVNVKGMSWTLILQPLVPEWVRKGDAVPRILHDDTDEPLIIVAFSVNWVESRHDEFVRQTTRSAVEQIDAFAAAHNTDYPYRFLNYCGDWQKPFEGYGEENLRFLRGVSKQYDPEGLFQRGCVGGFKLGMVDGKS